ncbi:MAG: endonuclease/exonuclease/phosphatase family protein, partial [Pseudomonadota bacterium]
PMDGEGRTEVLEALLAHPSLQDPKPRSDGGLAASNPDHIGDPGLDTADWAETGPGNLRVSYVLPATTWEVVDAGVFWPAAHDPQAALLGGDGRAAGPHRLVWVDIRR